MDNMQCSQCNTTVQDLSTFCTRCICQRRLEIKPTYGSSAPSWFGIFFKSLFSTRVVTTCWCLPQEAKKRTT